MQYPGLAYKAEDILACYQRQGDFILVLSSDEPFPFHPPDADAFRRWLDTNGIRIMPRELAERIVKKVLKG